MSAVARLVGYRSAHAPLRTGHWLPGELVGLAHVDAVAGPWLAEPATMPDTDGPVCVVPDTAVVRYAELDRVHRRARLEIGLHGRGREVTEAVLGLAVAYGFTGLNLRRLYGWVTPAAAEPDLTGALAACGLELEATVPAGAWLDGAVERQLWGVLRGD